MEEITVVTLDQLLEENGWDRCHFLKLDCEGAEHGIIRGMSAATAAKIDQIAMELHPLQGFDAEILIERLKSFGFSVRSRRRGVQLLAREVSPGPSGPPSAAAGNKSMPGPEKDGRRIVRPKKNPSLVTCSSNPVTLTWSVGYPPDRAWKMLACEVVRGEMRPR